MYRISFAHATPTHHISSVTLSRPSLTARLWCQKVDQIATTRLWKIVEQALSRVSACSFDDDDEEKKCCSLFLAHRDTKSTWLALWWAAEREREARLCAEIYIRNNKMISRLRLPVCVIFMNEIYFFFQIEKKTLARRARLNFIFFTLAMTEL